MLTTMAKATKSNESNGGNDRQAALDTVLGNIESKFGKGSMMKMSDGGLDVEAIPTGALSLDIKLGIGGLPKGRIIEIYGPEGSGKTTIVLGVIAEVQRQGGTCAFVDAENALDPEYATALGVDIDSLLVSQPDSGEQALEIVDMLVNSGAVDFVAVDSVAALVPKAELEGEIGDSHVGLQARMMGQSMRKLSGALNRNHCTVMFTNQIREKIGVMFGSPETTPGGRALKFFASVRLDIRKIETLKDGTDAYGQRVRVKTVKNKVAPPFKQAEFDIVWGKGIDSAGTLIDLGVEYKMVTKSGSFFSYGETRLGQGKPKSSLFLKENPEMMAELRQRILVEALPKLAAPVEAPAEIEADFEAEFPIDEPTA
jgi:recombination protein RecA